MKTTLLGHTNEAVSALCLGAMHFGTKTDEPTSLRLLDQYVDAGGTFIDTANVYVRWLEGFEGGESETLLAKWLKARGHRDKLFIATKMGSYYKDVPASLKAKYIVQECDKSLQRLGIDTIDLYYAHRDDRDTPQAETMEAFNRLHQAGKVRHIGASNFLAWRMEGAYRLSEANNWVRHCCIQQRHSYLVPRAGVPYATHTFANDDLVDFCRSRQVSIVAYSALAKGAYTRPDKEMPPPYLGDDNAKRLVALKTVADDLNATANQVVLAWMMAAREPNIIPLFSASSEAQMNENLGALEITLSENHLNLLNQAGRL